MNSTGNIYVNYRSLNDRVIITILFLVLMCLWKPGITENNSEFELNLLMSIHVNV